MGGEFCLIKNSDALRAIGGLRKLTNHLHLSIIRIKVSYGYEKKEKNHSVRNFT